MESNSIQKCNQLFFTTNCFRVHTVIFVNVNDISRIYSLTFQIFAIYLGMFPKELNGLYILHYIAYIKNNSIIFSNIIFSASRCYQQLGESPALIQPPQRCRFSRAIKWYSITKRTNFTQASRTWPTYWLWCIWCCMVSPKICTFLTIFEPLFSGLSQILGTISVWHSRKCPMCFKTWHHANVFFENCACWLPFSMIM